MVAMTDIDAFLPRVMTFAPWAPELRAIRMLREVAQEFCAATRIWRETDTITVETPESTAIADAAYEIIEIERADLDGTKLIPVMVDWLDDNEPDWRDATEDASPAKYVSQLGPDTVTVIPYATGDLTLQLIVKPTLTATTLPTFLYDHHAATLGKGAAAQLLNIPGENANPALAADLMRQFDRAKAAAKFTTAKGQQRAPLRTRARFM